MDCARPEGASSDLTQQLRNCIDHRSLEKLEYLNPPTAEQVTAHPDYKYFQPYITGFYLPKQAPKLTQAVSDQIDAMYKDGSLAALVTKWGGDSKQFLIPSPTMAADRRGVDRPQTWSPPSIAP
jgi:hypothetical protein